MTNCDSWETLELRRNFQRRSHSSRRFGSRREPPPAPQPPRAGTSPKIRPGRRHPTIERRHADRDLADAFGGGPLRLDRGGQPVDVPLDRLDAVLLNSQMARSIKPKGSYHRLVLRNGARLTVTSVAADRKTVTAKSLFGEVVRIPLTELANLTTLGGQAIYLSDLKPLRYESKPFLGLSWPLVPDRSVSGGDLRLGGGTYDKGIGLHSACSTTYAVPDGAVRFEAMIGLDEDTGRRGSVSMRIRSGDRIVFEDGKIMGRNATREVRVPLGPSDREITIEIGFGDGGDVQDDLDLGHARFVVTPRSQ